MTCKRDKCYSGNTYNEHGFIIFIENIEESLWIDPVVDNVLIRSIVES